jgi:hypothetical protein
METRFYCAGYLKYDANFKNSELMGDILLNCHTDVSCQS